MKKLFFLQLSLIFIFGCDNGFDAKPLVENSSHGTPTPTPGPSPTPTPTPTPGQLCGEAVLNWTNSTKNEDGSDIVESLASNVIYYGLDSSIFSREITVPNPALVNTYRLINLELGQTYYFALTQVRQDGVMSRKTGTVSKLITECAPPAEESVITVDVLKDSRPARN